MSTGSTISNLTGQQITVSEFITTHYTKVIPHLVKKHPFVAFQVISIGIELLGICISTYDYDIVNKSKDVFDYALSEFSSLKKYDSISIPCTSQGNFCGLYKALRCGILHGSRPNGDLILKDANNNLPTEIGLDDLSNDFLQACEDLISGKVWMGGNKSLNDTFCIIYEESK